MTGCVEHTRIKVGCDGCFAVLLSERDSLRILLWGSRAAMEQVQEWIGVENHMGRDCDDARHKIRSALEQIKAARPFDSPDTTP